MLCYLIAILNFFIDGKIKLSCLSYQVVQIIWKISRIENMEYIIMFICCKVFYLTKNMIIPQIFHIKFISYMQ